MVEITLSPVILDDSRFAVFYFSGLNFFGKQIWKTIPIAGGLASQLRQVIC
jgi:hypothetical protein